MPYPNTRKKVIRPWIPHQQSSSLRISRIPDRPGAPHNTTQYLTRNLVFSTDVIYEDDITEIRGTMEGVYELPDDDTDETSTC